MDSLRIGMRTAIFSFALFFLCAHAEAAPKNPDAVLGCQVLVAVKGLALAAVDAIEAGDAQGFEQLRDKSANVTSLAPQVDKAQWVEISPLLVDAQKAAKTLQEQREAVIKTKTAAAFIRERSDELLEETQALAVAVMSENRSASDVHAAASLMFLSQRLGRSASDYAALNQKGADGIFLLKKDPQVFSELLLGLRDGHAALRIKGTKVSTTRERIDQLERAFVVTRTSAEVLRSHTEGWVGALDNKARLLSIHRTLERKLEPFCWSAGA